MCTFGLEYVKLICGHSVHFSQYWAAARTWLIIQRNRLKVEGVCSIHVGILPWPCEGRLGVIQCTFLNIGP